MGQLLAGDPVDPGEEDSPGPVSVAVAVEPRGPEPPPAGEGAEIEPPEEPKARLVVFGDSDFLSDTEIANAGNLVLAVNAFNWLAAQEHALGIPPRAVDQSGLYLSAGEMNAVLLVTLAVIPGLAVVAGILVWRRRRH